MAFSRSPTLTENVASRLTDVPDFGDSITTASTLTLGTTVDGIVTYVNDRADWFRVTATSDGLIDIDLTDLWPAGLNLTVQSGSGEGLGSYLAFNSLSASFLATAGTDYYIAITYPFIRFYCYYTLEVDYSEYSGGAGADTFTGTLGDEWLAGFGGDDSLSGLGGNDHLFGGDGNDTLVGGDGDDELHGDDGADLIHGGEGADRIYAGADGATGRGGTGDDILYGDASGDYLDGGEDSDVLTGGDGGDTLHGGAGVDTLFGENGDDQVYGDDGDDWIGDDNGLNRLSGGAGDDTVAGGRNQDTLFGDAGRDVLSGNRSHDLIYGGDGDDTLYGGIGLDTLLGGEGNDVLVGTNSGELRDNGNRLFGGAGADTFHGGIGREVNDLGRADRAADVIVIVDVTESRADDRSDRIVNFESGIDCLDLSAVDADLAAAGDQSFAWGGTTATAQGVWLELVGPNLILWLDQSGDAVADASWRFDRLFSLTQDDFIL